MSTASVEHERVEILIDVEWSGPDTWYRWSVKTKNCRLTGTADSFDQALRLLRRRLRKLRRLADDIMNHDV